MIILGTNSIKDTGYDVANSLRFNSGSSDYLAKTFSSDGNRKKWTWSGWVKRSVLGTYQILFIAKSGSTYSAINLVGDQLRYFDYSSSFNSQLKTNRLFRDSSAWYHIVVAYDTTQGTAANRIKFYVNGVQETSFAISTYPSLNFDGYINESDYTHYIGTEAASGNYFDGYMSEVCFINDQQLDATSFGEFDEDSGIWKPKSVSGLTFGTNGFYLETKQSGTSQNSSGLGADTSGNDNHFAVNNLTAIDQSTDTCTNNFATLNPLFKQDGVFSEGNLAYTIAASDFDSALSTIAPSLGKWYFETKITALGSGTTRNSFGICDVRSANFYAENELGNNSSQTGDAVGYDGNGAGNIIKNGSSQYTNGGYTTNDIICCAVDLDNGAVYMRKNGDAWGNSGNPESGSSRTGAVTITTGEEYVFGNTAYNGSSFAMNFGSPSFAISSGNTDGDGFGNMEYAVPSGYYVLNSKNLSEYG